MSGRAVFDPLPAGIDNISREGVMIATVHNPREYRSFLLRGADGGFYKVVHYLTLNAAQRMLESFARTCGFKVCEKAAVAAGLDPPFRYKPPAGEPSPRDCDEGRASEARKRLRLIVCDGEPAL